MKIILPIILLLSCALALAEDQSFRLRANYVDRQFDASDVVAEIKFGKGLAARILGKYPIFKNDKIGRYVATIGSAVAAKVGRPELRYYFAVLDTKDVNAYACPGGYIFLTKGLMALMKHESQLVGVIAHEIAHVNERHVIKKLKIKGHDSSFASGLGSLIGGATASYRAALNAILDQGMGLLFDEGVQKEEELEADALAVETLMSLNYNIKEYYFMVKSIKDEIKSGRGSVVSRTHPSVERRLEAIRKVIVNNKFGLNTKVLLNASRYKQYVSL